MSKVPQTIKCLDITWEGQADCKHCAIRKNDIMADVDIAKYRGLLKRIVQFCYSDKSLLFVENTPAKELFVVRKGLVKLEKTLDDGTVRIVRLVTSGSVAGLEAFLNNHQRYVLSAIALGPTEVCRIPHQVVEGLLASDPQFYKAVLKEWHAQLALSDKTVVDYSTGSLKQRIARVLLTLIDEANRKQLVEIVKLKTDDMAALIGSTRESVSRTMADLKRKKILTKSGPNKMRFDEKAIRKIVEIESE